MSLTLYYHPLASYCWKVLIALYECEAPFDGKIIDLADPAQRAELLAISPFAKFPALVDRARGRTVYESTIVNEYLAHYHPGRSALLPGDFDAALEVRRLDRVFDEYVHDPLQKIVADILRPGGQRDPLGVEQARATLRSAYDVLERELRPGAWATGPTFTLADCAAAPALYYANRVEPFGAAHPEVGAYLARLHERPSFARVFAEAQPYLHLFPG